jgi:hypothetical protein
MQRKYVTITIHVQNYLPLGARIEDDLMSGPQHSHSPTKGRKKMRGKLININNNSFISATMFSFVISTA